MLFMACTGTPSTFVVLLSIARNVSHAYECLAEDREPTVALLVRHRLGVRWGIGKVMLVSRCRRRSVLLSLEFILRGQFEFEECVIGFA